MDDQNRYEEIEKKESVGSRILKYFKGLGYDFIASFKYNDLKLASWLIIIPGAIFGFFLHWHSTVVTTIHFNSPINDSKGQVVPYNGMKDISGLLVFLCMLCAIMLIFFGTALSGKKNLGSVITCTIATLLMTVFGGMYLYWVFSYINGINSYYDKLVACMNAKGVTDVEAAAMLVDKTSDFYIGSKGIYSLEKFSMNSDFILSIGTIILCIVSSIAGCVLGFIKYDRTYQKVDR